MTSNPDVPPFIGYVETTVNALRLIHAARQGVIPRITRRLNDTERRSMIKSGSVFVFSVEESGIKRWTDGLLWSPSRIVGNFLVYREILERNSSRGHKKAFPADDPNSRSLQRRNSPEHIGYTKPISSSDHGTFKPGGLIKKTITVTIDGSDLHLISYYTPEDIRSGKLKRPSSRPDIMSLYMPPHLFRLTNFRVPPKVEIGPDGKPRLVCEQEDMQEIPVECKVEDQIYQIPDSPSSWGSANSASPVDTQFPNNSLYHANGAVGNYRGASDRWSDVNSLTGRGDLTWNSHLIRRRDSQVVQDSWPSIHTQSNRWQDSSVVSVASNGGGNYPDRTRVRPGHPYEQADGLRRDNNGVSRRSESHRIAWHHRDGSHSSRDRRSPNSSFTPSPTIPFAAQGYHTSPSYTSSWTSDNTLMGSTPTLHPISNGSAYDSYSSNGGSSLSGPDDFGSAVEEFAQEA
ncbi:hypothetical protein CC1G_10044 [Coprinopsis cinerea okayama7|uniref:cAMP-independent regulatory protein pac2 n=1 Tax=Coprinopsis cinerea (strain Okayama-7 / 130 / ATCC MYA-4618 / FGSC 9003) TaxID=240176 RepID=A8NUW6_COPC7|nr:hypothetical protein CC1G_10044 [Coprinopsis cinerea okayama7\|eukprot:XP_001836550.2 hypothetical protein CC1G_10044 [Coprinopsis cinerea okayama7\